MDDDLQAVIRADFAAIGSSQWPADELDDITAWRRAARAVGKELGRPVKTTVVGDVALAYLTDWPRDEDEQLRHQMRLRGVVEGAASLPSAGDLFAQEPSRCPSCGSELTVCGGRTVTKRLHETCPSCGLVVAAFRV